MSDTDALSHEQVNDRLKEIIVQVSDDSIDLDDALALFEEAVGLGVKASALLEEAIVTGDGGSEGNEAESGSMPHGASRQDS